MQSVAAAVRESDQEWCQEVVIGNRLHPLQARQFHTLRGGRGSDANINVVFKTVCSLTLCSGEKAFSSVVLTLTHTELGVLCPVWGHVIH